MKIVIAMAGYGSRFAVQGYEQPKPIIDVKGKPMVWWALKSLPKVPLCDLIFIVNEKHVLEYKIDKILESTFGKGIKIIVQKEQISGQATTVLLAYQEIDNDLPLIIFNCDTYAPNASGELINAINKYPDCDGFIPVFNSAESNLSYVKSESNGIIVEVAEKKVISSDATIGLYYFKKGSDFVWAANEMINKCEKVNNEFYVMPLYQYLIDVGKKIRKLFVEPIYVLGTPSELGNFLKTNLSMRICIDLDGVISKLKQGSEAYSELVPVEDCISKIRDLKAQGHYIIIYTARHMKTCNGNLGLVNAKITQITLDWLKKYEIPFDEIYFGKPYADLYIDDNAFRFNSWSEIDITNLPLPHEKCNDISNNLH